MQEDQARRFHVVVPRPLLRDEWRHHVWLTLADALQVGSGCPFPCEAAMSGMPRIDFHRWSLVKLLPRRPWPGNGLPRSWPAVWATTLRSHLRPTKATWTLPGVHPMEYQHRLMRAQVVIGVAERLPHSQVMLVICHHFLGLMDTPVLVLFLSTKVTRSAAAACFFGQQNPRMSLASGIYSYTGR